MTKQGYDPDTNVLEWVQYPNDTESTRTEYTYDNMYRVASAAVTTDTGLDLSVGYTYTDDLLTKIATPTTDYNFTYGDFALRSSIKVGSQVLASYDYTDDGNFYLEKLAYGNEDSVQYTYDEQGRVTVQTWEDGDTVTYQYDNTGALATVTDSATGYTTTYYYDFTDRLMKYVESGEGYSHSVGYEYDEINNLSALVEVINGTTHTTSYSYDESYRVTNTVYENTAFPNDVVDRGYWYDAYGRLGDHETSHNGDLVLTHQFTYRTFPEGDTESTPTSTTGQVKKLDIITNDNQSSFNTSFEYTYDTNGNIASVTRDGKTTSYTYDTAGQLLWEYNEEAQTAWNWTYDNAGNILTRTEYAYSDGALGEAVSTVTYGYDDDNWGDLLTSYNGKTITYDEIGNPVNDGTWAYTWQHGRQLASMNSEKTTLEFNYNADGMRMQKVVTTTSDHVHSFQDTVHQPTCTKNGYTLHECICGYIYQDSPVPATGHDFTTTVVGTNCTEVGHTVYTCECGYSYEDGSNGHTFTTLVVEPSETINGFTLHECECGYSYQSAPVASLAGASNAVDVISDTKVYNYVYNGSSLTQLTITTTITGDGTSAEELYFTYDGSSPMSVTYNGEIFYYVTNLQGDVIAILDSNGVAVVTYSYDAWGNILEIGGSKASDLGVANPLTYRGYVYDTETSLYYLQSRYYNPKVGRFINADAIISAGGLLGYNMFAYCGNNPIILYDPSGYAACTWDGGSWGVERMSGIVDSGGGGGSGGSGVIAVGAGIAAIVIVVAVLITDAVVLASDKPSAKDNAAVVTIASISTSQDSAVYYGCDFFGGNMNFITGPMSFGEADAWATTNALNNVYTNRAAWGLYTSNMSDAASMAVYLGCPDAILPDYSILLPDLPKTSRHYTHFHTFERKIHGISAQSFHIWFGNPGG